MTDTRLILDDNERSNISSLTIFQDNNTLTIITGEDCVLPLNFDVLTRVITDTSTNRSSEIDDHLTIEFELIDSSGDRLLHTVVTFYVSIDDFHPFLLPNLVDDKDVPVELVILFTNDQKTITKDFHIDSVSISKIVTFINTRLDLWEGKRGS